MTQTCFTILEGRKICLHINHELDACPEQLEPMIDWHQSNTGKLKEAHLLRQRRRGSEREAA